MLKRIYSLEEALLESRHRLVGATTRISRKKGAKIGPRIAPDKVNEKEWQND
jgi:hypothetical protein